MKFDVELIGLPARIKVKFAPESMPVFEPNPRFSYDRALAWFDKEINNRIENYVVNGGVDGVNAAPEESDP